jgi:RimJ/RimL family protein N-acetyltransferase
MNTGPGISVRKITDGDLRTPILKSLLPNASMRDIAALDSDGSASLSIVRGEEVVGMASIKADGELMAFVADSHRRQGIAATACHLAIRHGFASMHLDRVYARARIGSSGERLARRIGLHEYDRRLPEVFLDLSKPDWLRRETELAAGSSDDPSTKEPV